jgi:hypothetical protein
VDLCLSIGSNGQIKSPLDISICPLDILQRYWRVRIIELSKNKTIAS